MFPMSAQADKQVTDVSVIRFPACFLHTLKVFEPAIHLQLSTGNNCYILNVNKVLRIKGGSVNCADM